MNPGAQSHSYRPDIDGLRAIAVLSVLGYHAFPTLIPGGFAGVDVFFVISGYLISGILFTQSERGKLSIAGFYSRRIRRIFPGLALLLFAALGAGMVVLSPDELRELGRSVAAGAGFVANINLWLGSGYFDHAAATKPLLHLWSLGVEEQFYIVWPLVILALGRRPRALAIVLPALASVSFGVSVIQVHYEPAAAFYLPGGRFWELLAGAILARIDGQSGPSPLRGWLPGWLGAALLAGSFFFLNETLEFPGWCALPPVAGAFLVILAGADAWPNRRLFSLPALVFIGLISYPLYLWHWPFLTFARLLFSGTPGVAVRLCILLLSGLLAWLTTRFLERPARAAAGWRPVGALCLAMTAAGTLGLLAAGRSGSADSGPLARAHATMTVGGDVGRFETLGCGLGPHRGNTVGFCVSDSREAPVNALLGDSHAGALYPSLLRESEPGGRWMLIGHPGCLPALGIDRLRDLDGDDAEVCRRAVQTVVPALAANPGIRTVVIATAARVTGTLSRELSEGKIPRYARAGTGRADPEAVAEGLSATVARLSGAGKRVVLLIDNPSLADPPDCVTRVAALGLPVNPACAMARAQANADYRAYRSLIADLQRRRPDLIVFDPTDLLCPGGTCRVINDGVSWYSYTDHLSDAGGTIVARALIAFLSRQAAPDSGADYHRGN